ncbi:beta strand repeat-containing protein [Spirosoma rhododendri]|uniref:Uncharacterized protein n=1 Tax=Spirosoma rhododendri TaxID=2728024 RepID=A0A7L5DIT5_9BACT|nr:hypothetical protein [Spirosoma rhododendri]QJD77003.1 hypothetical protein HH216_00170 [Spirosoma rhododendri]
MSAVGGGTNAQFTSNPNGPAGTGIDVATNYSFTLFTAAEALPATSVSARNDFGTMTVTFSQPVTNPVLDFVGLGGTYGTEGFSTEFTLTSVGGPASVALSKLSGSSELVVSGNQINNQGSGGTLAAACGTGGACGSVLVTGTNITSLTFRVYLRGDGKGTAYTGTGVYTGDRWLLGVSLQSPFSLSGTVFDDANGLTNNTIDGTPINTTAGSTPSTPLYAYLTDASSATATILASTIVSNSGTYSFSAANANPRVILSTTPPGSLTLAPAASLPANWTTIAEGTATGGDGTPDGTTSLTLTTASPTANNVNFAIDQIPSGSNYTAANQLNPGGTNTVNVPTAAFTGTDPEDGTYAQGLSGRRVGLGPATNGTLYYNGTAVTSSIIISSFNPSLVTLDPADGVVTATFPYTVYDNALVPSATSNTISMPFSIGISGTVFDDANGLTDNLINGTATNAGGLFAILTNAASTSVLANAVVSTNGTYSFTGLAANTYSIRLSTTSAVVGSTPPAVSLPANWTATGEGTAAAGDGTPNGVTSVTLTTTSITNANFGLDQLPTPTSSALAAQANPGGTNGVSISPASFTGTDPDGTVASIRYTAFPTNTTSLTIGATVYTSANFPAGGVTVATGTTIAIDPVDGAVTAVIPFRVIDNAGQESTTTGTVSVPFTTLTLSGTVFDDANGLTDNTINGTGTNAGGLFAILTDAATGNVIANTPVASTGAYSFSALNGGSYSVRLSTTSATIGTTAPAPAAPANWVFTGEGTAAAGDGTPNGVTSVTLTTANLSGVNFGLDQLPTPTSATLVSQANPGGTNGVSIPPASFTGTDPDGTVASIRYTAFPTNTTSLTIGTTAYTSANFPAGGVTAVTGTTVRLDPVDGAVTAVIPFRVIDNAGQEGTTTGSVSVPFTTLTLSGTVFDDANGLTDNTINGTGTNAGGSSPS